MYPDDVGKYGRNPYGIRKLQDNVVYFAGMTKIDSDLTKVLKPGDVVVVDGRKHIVLRSDDVMNGDLFIAWVSEDLNTRITKISYLVEQHKIEAVQTGEQFMKNCYFIDDFKTGEIGLDNNN